LARAGGTDANTNTDKDTGTDGTNDNDNDNYTANILLLSISNADKKLAPSDATYLQRLEMMVLMADTLATPRSPGNENENENFGGVAIILMNEPLFAQKQKILAGFLPSVIGHGHEADSESGVDVDLVWQVGLDTLERLFQPKYYDGGEGKMRGVLGDFLRVPSGSSYGAKLLCARRIMGGVGTGTEAEAAAIPGTESFFQSGRIEVVDVGSWESTLSSTSVRKGVRESDECWMQACETNVQEYIIREKLYL